MAISRAAADQRVAAMTRAIEMSEVDADLASKLVSAFSSMAGNMVQSGYAA